MTAAAVRDWRAAAAQEEQAAWQHPAEPAPDTSPPRRGAARHHHLDALTAPAAAVPAVPWAHTGRRWSSLGPPAVRCETGRCAGGRPMVHTDPAAHTIPECWDSAQRTGWRLDWIGARTCPSCQEDVAYRSGHTRLHWPPVLYEPGVYWRRGRKYFHVTPAAPPPPDTTVPGFITGWPTGGDTPLPAHRWPRFRRTP